MKTFNSKVGALCASALMTASAASPLTAEDLRFAIGYPPNSSPVEVMEDYAAKVEELSGGAMTVKVFPASLLSFPETSPGVRDGIADMGLLATGYHPSEYPINNIVPNTTISLINYGEQVKNREAMAYASALTEFTFFHCPECNAEFAEQNQVFTSIASTSAYYMMCNQPVPSLEVAKTLRLRAPSNWARWANYIGATPTNVNLGEMNEAMSQGVLDCLVASAAELINWNLTDLVQDIVIGVPGGVAAGAPVNINMDTWQGLSSEDRKVLMQAAAFSQAQYAWMFHQREAEAIEAAKEAGATVHEADQSLIDATKAFVEEDIKSMLVDVEEQYGIMNGAELIETFTPILDKWVEIAAGIDSAEALETALWEEVFSKVDVDAHGM